MPGMPRQPQQPQQPNTPRTPDNSSAVSVADSFFKLALPTIKNITPENSSLMISSIDSFKTNCLTNFTTLMAGEDPFFGAQRIAKIDTHLTANTKYPRLSDSFSELTEPSNFLAANEVGVKSVANSIKAQYSLLNSIAVGLNSVRPPVGSNEEKFFRVQEKNLKAYLGSLNYLIEKVIGGYLYTNARNMSTLDPILSPLSDDEKDTYVANIDSLWSSINPDFAAEQSRLILGSLGIQSGGPLGRGPDGSTPPNYPPQDSAIAALMEQNRRLMEQVASLTGSTQRQNGGANPQPNTPLPRNPNPFPFGPSSPF